MQELQDAKKLEDDGKQFVKKIADSIREREWPIYLEMQSKQLTLGLARYAIAANEGERNQITELEPALEDVKMILAHQQVDTQLAA